MPRVILSGPFCCGKTTLRNRLEKDLQIPKLIDHSTRDMRPGETQGNPYQFLPMEEFKKNQKEGMYHEVLEFKGNFYGVPKSALKKKSWSLDIHSKSFPFYEKIPNIIAIYLDPPDISTLKNRAKKRGDSQESIDQRIEALKEERADLFQDRVSANQPIDKVYEQVKKIILENSCKHN